MEVYLFFWSASTIAGFYSTTLVTLYVTLSNLVSALETYRHSAD